MRDNKFTICMAVLAAVALATNATAQMRITEVMYSGTGDEFVEFTNVGGAPIDMTGWSFDDVDGIPGTEDLSAFGVVAPGASVIFTDGDAATFIADWSLSGVSVIGNNANAALGRNDVCNLFDASDTLVDQLHYGDQDFPGTPRPQDFSIWPCSEAVGADNVYQWNLAADADAAGSYVSAQGDVGNPGTANTISCGAPAQGACCSAGVCTVLLQTTCLQGGGLYQGDGTGCAPNPCPQPSAGIIRITEWMYQGAGEEFFELTNLGLDPVNMIGWSMDDNSAAPGTVDLSALGTIAPGESVVVTEDAPLAFSAKWGLASVNVITISGASMGRADQINIFDSSGTLADVLTYGDEDFPGTIRTSGRSGWPCESAVGADDIYGWLFSSVDDAQNSVASTDGDVGNPGTYIPNDCTAIATGACCFAGVCTDETATQCLLGGRDYQGDPTDCGSFTCPAPSGGAIRITEYMYTGEGDEFIEFTNLDVNPIDMTGWSFDDDSTTPGTVDLTAFGVVQPGESVILTDADSAAAFIADWGLAGVDVIAGNPAGLGRNDMANLYDAGGVIADQLTYGDEDFPGTHRANGVSAWGCQAAIGNDDIYNWPASEAGDVQSSYFSSNGDLGNPGMHVQFDCVGGCCQSDGTCTDGQFGACVIAGGDYAGHGTVCAGTDADGDGFDGLCDNCPADANPGQEDCDGGLTPEGDACETNSDYADDDGDGVCNVDDGCPMDPNKVDPGICGCGVEDVDTDGDGTYDCDDGCDDDPNKIAPGVCGCGLEDIDTDGDGAFDCEEECDTDPNKTAAGQCGCGVPDTDSDGDGAADCNDECPGVDDAVFAPGCAGAIPAVSEWGLVILALALLVAGKLRFSRLSGRPAR